MKKTVSHSVVGAVGLAAGLLLAPPKVVTGPETVRTVSFTEIVEVPVYNEVHVPIEREATPHPNQCLVTEWKY